jgi:uncharacterized protein (TIGR03083 family)
VTPDEFLARVPLVKTETGRLSARLHGFSESDWQTPTYCPGWTAVNVVSHITTGAEFYAHSARRAVDDLPSEPPYGNSPQEFWDLRKAKGEKIMTLPRDEMVALFDSTSAELQEALERIKAGDLEKLAYHPRGETPLDAWICMRLVELDVHEWDINYGHDSTVRVVPQGVEGLIIFVPSFAARLFNRREKKPFEARYHFRSTDPDREWTVGVSGERAEASPVVSGDYDAVITADGEAHLLLPYGRLDRAEAAASGRLRVEGDQAAADAYLNVVYTKY